MKKLLIVLLTLVMVLPLFANAAAETAVKETVDTSGPITLEFWTHEDATRMALEDKWIKEFIELHPNVTVNVTRQSSDKMLELIQTAYAAGNGPTVWNLSIDRAVDYIKSGLVAPVDYETVGFKNVKALTDFYAEGILKAVEYEGDVYGLPFEIVNWCVAVNKNVFRDAGLDPEKDLPKTWEDVVEVSKKIIIRDGDIIKRRGFDFRYGFASLYFVPMVEQLGGKLSETEGCVNKEAWIKALTFMQQWGPAGENLGNPTLTAPRKLFNANNNNVAMCLTGYYQISRIKAENPSFYESGEWTFIPFPQFKDAVFNTGSAISGQYYMVNSEATAAEQKMGWELIKYFLLAEGHQEEYTKITGVYYFREGGENITANLPYVNVFTDDMAISSSTYKGKNATAIQDAMNTAIKNVMLQGVTPEKAYQTMQETVLELLND